MRNKIVKPNDKGERRQEPAVPQNSKPTTSKSGSPSAPAPLLGGLSETEKAYFSLWDNNQLIDSIEGNRNAAFRPIYISLAINRLIKNNDGIKPNQKIRITPENPKVVGSIPQGWTM